MRLRRPAATPAACTAVPATIAVARATLLLACLGGCGPAPIESVSIARGTVARGLVAHWPFDEQSGMTVGDRSGNGYDGQLTGATWSWVPTGGRFGGGLRLQPGDSVTIPAFQQATADWTVSVWMKFSPADRAAFAADRAVLLTNERAAMGGWEIEFDPRPGFDYLEASYYVAPPTNDYVILKCKCIDPDRWHQWTAVFDSTKGAFSLYHNGLLADAASLHAPILPGAPNLEIGRWNQGPRSISGVIDDFAIWSRALDVNEIATLNASAAPDSL